MALDRNARYPGRFDAPTSGQPQGAFKNRTSNTARDGSYFEKDWINDIVAHLGAALARTNQTANGNVDAVGASQYFDAFERMRVTEPLNNTWNGFFRRSQAGISSPAGFPATGGTVYAANAEFTLNWFSGAAANNIAITDANGITFTQPIYIQFDLDAASDLTVDDIYIHIVDQGGNPHWFKNGEAGGAVVITLTGNTLRVQLAASILSFGGITSIKSAFVQSEAGFISELDNGSVLVQSLALLQTVFATLAGNNTLTGDLALSKATPTISLDNPLGGTSSRIRLTELLGLQGLELVYNGSNNRIFLSSIDGGSAREVFSFGNSFSSPLNINRTVTGSQPPHGANHLTRMDWVSDRLYGVGQTPQDETANRVSNTTYTNADDKAITVYIAYTSGANLAGGIQVFVGGVEIVPATSNRDGSLGWGLNQPFVVPAGLTYRVVTTNAGITISKWVEVKE